MLRSLFNLFYPASCKACHARLLQAEQYICTNCRHELPVTNLHFTKQRPIHKLLYGRVELELATALFYFDKKSKVQQLIHNLKYRGQKNIGAITGKWLGAELASLDKYHTIDYVIPVPLHKSRLRDRGYNQVDGFGKALAEALNKPFIKNVLYRKTSTRTQVFLNRSYRGTNVLKAFDVKNTQKFENKHILLVDDLITTGGTVEGCSIALKKIPGIKISLAFIAMAE